MMNNARKVKWDRYIALDVLNHILGIEETTPLSIESMSKELKVTFHSVSPVSVSLENFFSLLKNSFKRLEIEVLDFEKAIGKNGKVRPGIAVFIAGMDETSEDLFVSKVSSLYQNPIIGVYEKDCPAKPNDSNQKKLDSIVSVLAYDVVHLAIFINYNDWTIATMNGAVITNSLNEDIDNTITNCLIPKLTAQVVPPNVLTNIQFRKDKFNPDDESYKPIINDFVKAARLIKKDGMIMSHTSISSLKYKNKFHERIVRAYLDERTGMSYGFMAWQLPVDSAPATIIEPDTDRIEKLNSKTIKVNFAAREFLVEIPDIWVLSTRSGSDKANLNPATDIVKMGLVEGKIIFDVPIMMEKEQDIRPSYDTLAILAHALGNSIISSIIKSIYSACKFSDSLAKNGASLFHWHGYLLSNQLPDKHYIHGMNNPSVSCSTKQSAVYSLLGKFEALEECLKSDLDFMGDVHIEPHHGSNISSTFSLLEVVNHLHSINLKQEV